MTGFSVQSKPLLGHKEKGFVAHIKEARREVMLDNTLVALQKETAFKVTTDNAKGSLQPFSCAKLDITCLNAMVGMVEDSLRIKVISNGV
jgi:hypothetical protein